jgi:chorismate mutase
LTVAVIKKLAAPYVAEADRTPAVMELLAWGDGLVEIIHRLLEERGHLKDEVAVLKGEKKRPTFKPSRMNEDAGKAVRSDWTQNGEPAKRPGSEKKSKTWQLKIDRDEVIEPAEPIPLGSRFKGYRDFVVQDLVIESRNTRYRLARWETPDGQTLIGQLPEAVGGGHFGPTLASYVLYQHHHCHVTQPLLREQLREWGIEISSGQVNALLQGSKERFHAEKDGLLSTGLALSTYVTVDDTGTRHQGNNGYVTHVGNAHFAWFQSTRSKSRINFLELLRAGHSDYQINEDALAYMKKHELSHVFLDALRQHESTSFADQGTWQHHLDRLGMDTPRYRNIATEGALLGSLKRHGVARDLAIISDDAGQFNVLIHGLCWVHAERLVHKMLPLNDQHREDIARVRDQIWTLYADLKAYKLHPTTKQKRELATRFDVIFTQKTRYATLNRLLRRIHLNKSELLLVLERPEVPLHTNDSERDIRDHVKKQKISGGTRSELGRQCRDTFSSLKKTCRKLGISFWEYLTDRISCSDQIPLLPHLVEQRIALSA